MARLPGQDGGGAFEKRDERGALGLIADRQVRVDITAEYELPDLALAVRRLAEGATLGRSVLRVA